MKTADAAMKPASGFRQGCRNINDMLVISKSEYESYLREADSLLKGAGVLLGVACLRGMFSPSVKNTIDEYRKRISAFREKEAPWCLLCTGDSGMPPLLKFRSATGAPVIYAKADFCRDTILPPLTSFAGVAGTADRQSHNRE